MSDPNFAPTNPATEVLDFAVEPFDNVIDLCGDPLMAGLVAFFAGNQFMVLPELMEAFLYHHPEVGPVYYETLPPGILLDQVRAGSLRMGSLILSVKPDVLALGPAPLSRMTDAGTVEPAIHYASNGLALLVASGNPAEISGLADLGRSGLRVAMPDPDTEAVGGLIMEAIRSAGGNELVEKVMVEKVAAGETRLTQIHHRQSPQWLRADVVDVAPLWQTEAGYHSAYHSGLDRPLSAVGIDAQHDKRGEYSIAVLSDAPHIRAANSFVEFIRGAVAQQIYRKYGFAP